MTYDFTRTGPQIQAIHDTVSDPSTNQAFTDAIGEIVTPKYTDIVYKASGGNSAVENMVAEFAVSPMAYAVGAIIKTGGTTWEYVDSTGPITIDNFRAFNAACVRDFGAKGNWNAELQTGSDDTVAIQKAVDYVGSKNYRNGGGIALWFPGGSYSISATINLRSSGGFGFSMIGDERQDSVIYSSIGAGSFMFDCDIEEPHFSKMFFFGNATGLVTDIDRSDVFNFYTDDGAADVDARFNECQSVYVGEFAHVRGRGFTAIACGFGHTAEILVIESPNPWVQKGSDDTDSLETGMRNYLFDTCRFDACGVICTTLGVGPAQNYIHDVQINNCNGVSVDKAFSVGARVGVTPTSGRLLGSGINGGSYKFSFATGVVDAYDIEDFNVSGSKIYKLYNVNDTPTLSSETIQHVVKAISSMRGITIEGNPYIGPIERAVVECTGTVCEDIIVSDNNLRGLFEFVSAAGSNQVIRCPTSSSNIIIRDNILDSKNTVITEDNFYITEGVAAQEVSIRGNTGNIDFIPFNNSYDPSIIIGGDDSLASYSVRNGRWFVDGNYVELSVNLQLSSVSGSPSGGDSVRVSLPLPAFSDPGVGTSFSAGSGDIGILDNVSLTSGELIQSVVAFGGNNYADIKIMTTTGQRNLNYGNISQTFALSFNIRYRYK